jgi:hypothetical protein
VAAVARGAGAGGLRRLKEEEGGEPAADLRDQEVAAAGAGEWGSVSGGRGADF